MKSSPQVSLSSAMKRSLLSFAALFLVLSALGGNVLAVPIAVDLYQDMESGNAGNTLSSTIMNASTHPSTFSWYANGSSWVSTNHHMDLPGAILAGGVTYNGTGGTRSWMFNNNNQQVYVHGSWSSPRPAQITAGYYFNTGWGPSPGMDIDTVSLTGTTYLVMQTLNHGAGPSVRPHSSYGGYGGQAGPSVAVTSGKTYWINLHTDINVHQGYVAVFDPANSYAQVGTTVSVVSDNTSFSYIELGRIATDSHGNLTYDSSQCYFDQVMIDYTNAAFPLLPGGSNDSTAPSAPPVVRGGTGPDQDQTLALSSTQLSANWDPAWDAQSGVKGYQYAIGTAKGGTDVVGWTTLPCQFGVTKTGLSLTNGQTYYFAVRAINGVGLTGPITNSGGQTYGPTDTTPPGAPTAVRDGSYLPGPDADYNQDPHDMYANFDGASDQESGISGYQFCIGTTPGGTDALNWTSLAGLFRGTFATNINPPNGLAPGRYYTSVRAVNNTGIVGPATSSNGMTIANASDTTPPTAPPAVRDGTGADISTQTSTTQLSANWDNGTDPESGVREYQYSIGTTPGGTQIANSVDAGYDSPVSHVTVTGLSLSVGQTYYFSVKSINGVWLSSSWTNSNGVTIVSGGNQPPSAPANVRDGTGTDIAYTTSTTQLSANWDASTDPDGSVTAYQYAIGTSAGGTQTVNWTTLGNVTTVTKTGLSLTNGQTYYFSVKAVDNQGLAGNATNSNGQTVDTTAPSAPANVRDGTGTDISTTSSTTQLSANWDAATDAESGITSYQYAIGTSAGGTQTVNWTALGNVTTVTKTGLTLSVGQTYYFSVKAVNGAGLVGNATNSNGQTVVTASNVVYFSDNFESWTVHGGAWSSVTGESSTHTLNTSTDYAKAGSKCLKITDSDTTATSGASLTKNFSPVISGDIYVRFFVFLPTGYGSANSTCTRRLLRVYTDTGNYTVLTLAGDGLSISEVGGWSGTVATNISENAWHCVELHVAPPSASTAIQYWVDGTSAGTLTGAYSGSSTFNYIQFGDVTLASGTTNSTGTIYWDELVVSNYYNGTIAATTYFQDNFENWTVHGGAWSTVNGESSSHTLNTSTDYARAGTKSLKITDTDSTETNGASLTKNFSPVISSDIYVRFYIFLPTGYGSANTNCSRRILRVYTNTSNYTVITLQGAGLYIDEVGGWSGTALTPISENAWHCVELHVAPPSASTAIQYWIDGTSAGTCTGAYSGSSTFNYMQFGDVTLASGSTNGTGTIYWDEVIVSDTYNGPLP